MHSEARSILLSNLIHIVNVHKSHNYYFHGLRHVVIRFINRENELNYKYDFAFVRSSEDYY